MRRVPAHVKLSGKMLAGGKIDIGLFSKIVLFFLLFLVLGIVIIICLAPHLDWNQEEQIGLFQFWAEVVGFGFAGVSLYLALRRPILSVILDPQTKSNFALVMADGDVHDVVIYVWNPSEIEASHVIVDLEIWDEIREPLGIKFLRLEGDLATLNPSGLGTWSIASRHGRVGWIWHGGEVAIPGRSHLGILSLPVKLERRTEPQIIHLKSFFIEYHIWGENTKPGSGGVFIQVLSAPESSSCSSSYG